MIFELIGEIVSFIISAIILAPFFLLLFYVFRFVWRRMPDDVSKYSEPTSDPSLDGFEFMDSPVSDRFTRAEDLYGHLPLHRNNGE